jgi:hypothetical protein
MWESVAGALVLLSTVCLVFHWTRWGETGTTVFVLLLLIWMVAHGVDGYVRGHWRFNSRLVPEAIIDTDGKYTDGTSADAMEQALGKPGSGATLVIWFSYACGGWSGWELWRAWRLDQRIARERAEQQRKREKYRRAIAEGDMATMIEFCKEAERECGPGKEREEFIQMRQELEELHRRKSSGSLR